MITLEILDEYKNIILKTEETDTQKLFALLYKGLRICHERGNGPAIWEQKGKKVPQDIDYVEIFTSNQVLTDFLNHGVNPKNTDILRIGKQIQSLAQHFDHITIKLVTEPEDYIKEKVLDQAQDAWD